MKSESKRVILKPALAILCAVALIPGDTLALAQGPPPPSWTGGQEAAAFSPDQLDSLVAPVALFPDPLLAQVLAASTYPLEIAQLQQWLARNKTLQGVALADAAARQPWDPSVQALAPLPDLVNWLASDLQWTTDLGNAFLAQEGDVMDAVQRMRMKAQQRGTLKSTPEQTVQTQTEAGNTVIVIQPANPQVLYIPAYDPTAVWGPPVYPFPVISSPGWGAYAATAALSFGAGVAMGAFWGGGWGWGFGWGGRNVFVNNNNFFFRNNPGWRGGGRSNWAHNPRHRGGAPYRNRATANRFGGTSRGASMAERRAGAGRQIGRQGGNLAGRPGAGGPGVAGPGAGRGPGNRGGIGAANRATGIGGGPGPGGPGAANRAPGAAGGPGRGGIGSANRAAGIGGGPGRGGIGSANRAAGIGGAPSRGGIGSANRAAGIGGVPSRGGIGSANRAAGIGGGFGGPNSIGGQNLSRPGGGNRSAFGGGSRGFSGPSARSSSNRGFSSLGARSGGMRGGGGGFARGGGGGFRGGRGGGRRR